MEHRSLVIVKKFEYELATQHNFYQEDEEKRLNQKLVELAEEISIINNSISKTREKSKQEGLAEEEVLELKQNIDELMVKRENIEKECKKLEAKKYEKEKLSTHTLHISVEEFEQRLFTLSKLVRNSIMYLSLAINLDTKIKQLNSNAIIMPRQTPLKE
ncbi:hypothetical protein JCM19233_6197 [Vibrio astriarenae]|nr:hypothetical protein JCM19233_6197 [Vibrio sp. C7]